MVDLSSRQFAGFDQADRVLPDIYTHPEWYFGSPRDEDAVEDRRATNNLLEKIRGKPDSPVQAYFDRSDAVGGRLVSGTPVSLSRVMGYSSSEDGNQRASVVQAGLIEPDGNALGTGAYMGPSVPIIGPHRENVHDIISKYSKVDVDNEDLRDDDGRQFSEEGGFLRLAQQRFETRHLASLMSQVARQGVRRPIGVDYSTTPPTVSDGHTRLISAASTGMRTVPVVPRTVGWASMTFDADDDRLPVMDPTELHFPRNARYPQAPRPRWDD